MKNNGAKVGVVVAPRYFDTTTKELAQIAPDVDILHTQIRVDADFGFSLEEIAQTGDEIEQCALSLRDAGAEIVIQLGTPFSTAHGWAGGNTLQQRIEDRIEIPFEMMGLSVPAAAIALGAKRIAMPTTYYNPEWVARYTEFATDAGLEVVATESFVDQGVFETNEQAWAASFVGFSPNVLASTIGAIATNNPGVDCILMPGLPGRFLEHVSTMEADVGVPVVSYFSIWWRCLNRLGIEPVGDCGTLMNLT
ncbi:MAG: hypothetical protein GXP35_12395 [Actinobacteria bacterium]|nr:hypothetical protein [Actinomycetota bacterium]